MTSTGQPITFPMSQPASAIPTGTVFDVVVIGSGYGGAVVAYRCAAFGYNVALLERGAETPPAVWSNGTGGYPNTLQGLNAAMEIETDSGSFGTKGGLFNLRVGEDVSVLVGSGLGGGSLINASVALRAHKKVLSGPAWPQVFQANPDLLTPYYEMAEKCLGSNPYPAEVGGVPSPPLNKVTALKEAAKAVDKPFELLPINVAFDAGANYFGFQQNACVLCGDCMTGCNYGAKSTTLMNYLPAAVATKRAQIFTGAEVDSIEQLTSGVWQVYLTGPGDPAPIVQAKRVVLAAGSLGSTEILLRSKTKRNLQVSPTLGSRFSTNGDYLAFGYDTDWRADGVAAELLQDGHARLPIHGVGSGNRIDLTAKTFSSDAALRPGPSTAGIIKYEDDLDVGNELIIEEGTLPSAFNMIIPPLQFLGSALKGDFFQYADSAQRLQDAQALGTAIQSDLANIADEAYRGPVSRTQMYLVMSHDDSAGSLTLDATTQKARVNWPGAGRERVFRHEDRTLAKVNQALRGTMLHDPLWSDALGRQLITVHPLGGCPMADSSTAGVVNDAGQVFKPDSTTYDSLWVCDGSIIPTSLGVNPLLTITALAERIACLMTRGAANCPPPNDAAASIGPAVSPAAAVQPPAGAAEVSGLVTQIPPGTISGLLSALLSNNKANPEGSPPFTIAANAAAAAALQTLLKSTGQQLDKPTQGAVSTALQTNQLATIQSHVMTTILKPLDESAVAWSASDNPDPSLLNAVMAQFEKLVQLLPIGFTPALKFSEKMHGWMWSGALPHLKNDGTNIANPYEVASGYGEYQEDAMGAGTYFTADLQISTPDLNALATTPDHSAAVSGTLDCGLLSTSNSPVPVSGTLALLITDPERVEACQMIYQLQGTNAQGNTVEFHGVKYLRRRPGSSPWTDLTTLYTTVTMTDSQNQSTVCRGVLRLNLQDAIALAASVFNTQPPQPTQPSGGIVATLAAALSNYPTAAAQLTDMVNLFFVAQFAGFFSQAVFRIYGGLLADLENFPAQDNQSRQHRPLQTPPPEVHPLRTPDGFDLQLTRYNPGLSLCKPVILAPGFLTSAASFAADTVSQNVVEYLNKNGYDVWLFDYRGSPALPAGRAFTVDDIATNDWPSAIDYVCAVAGVAQVRVLAHCVGSLSFLMALLREPAQSGVAPAICQQIQSAVCSQLTLHPVTNWLNYLKVDFDVLGILEKTFHVSSVDLVSTNTTASQMIDAFLWSVPVPPGEECVNPLCHRVFSVFGPSWAHAQLNADTHNALLEWFGTVPAEALQQLTTIMKEGKAVDHKGQDVYLPNVANLSNVPITFIAGELNQIFTPESSLITLQWLREKLPASAAAAKYNRRVFPGYAHMDHWIGKNAYTDIFPSLPAMLDPPT